MSKGEYTARLVGLLGISLCSNKYKTKNLGCFQYMFIGEPGGSNTSWVANRSRAEGGGSETIVLIEAGSLIQAGSLIEARGSDTIVLIEAGGFY